MIGNLLDWVIFGTSGFGAALACHVRYDQHPISRSGSQRAGILRDASRPILRRRFSLRRRKGGDGARDARNPGCARHRQRLGRFAHSRLPAPFRRTLPGRAAALPQPRGGVRRAGYAGRSRVRAGGLVAHPVAVGQGCLVGPGLDERVSADPDDPHFSLSFGGEAFFVVGLHPKPAAPRAASRARR